MGAAAGRRSPAAGKLEGPGEYRFSTDGSGVLAVQPYPGSEIEEDPFFLLQLNGVALPANVARGAWCEVEGVGERIAVRRVEGAARHQLLRQRRIKPAAAPAWRLLACERPSPAEFGVRLVWGPGIAAAANTKVVTRGERPFQWRVRPRFTPDCSGERERANAPCMPLRPPLRPPLVRYHRFAPPSPADRVATAAQEEATPNDGARIITDRLQATTDAQGAATVALKNLPTLKGPSERVTDLGFSDPNGELQTASQRLNLRPSAVVVGIQTRHWAASRGEAHFGAVVLDTAGRPLKGREVVVSVRLNQTLSARKRIAGGFHACDNQREVREVGVLCRATSDAAGRVNCNAAIDAVGEVELIARATDGAGRVRAAAASVWMTGAGELWFAQDSDERIDVRPDKREVEPGETARQQVRMPFHQATALVTVQREGVIDSRIDTLRGRQPIVELPIPGTVDGGPSWAPNVIVCRFGPQID